MPQLSQSYQANRPTIVAATPCFNTKPFIEGLVCRARNHVDQAIVIDDGSHNRTGERQGQGLLSRSDVVIGISTSGESPNVLRAMEEAKRCGAITVAFTGQEGSLSGLADYVLSIPSVDTPRIQEAHITAGHIICYLVEEALFNKE